MKKIKQPSDFSRVYVQSLASDYIRASSDYSAHEQAVFSHIHSLFIKLSVVSVVLSYKMLYDMFWTSVQEIKHKTLKVVV